MVLPMCAATFAEALRWRTEVYHSLNAVLQEKGLSTGLGDEGGFAPNLDTNRQALEVIVEAIEKAGYTVGEEIALGLDVASSELFNDGSYTYDGEQRDAAVMIDY